MTSGRLLHRLAPALCGALLLSACAGARGELVESGFDAPAPNDVELAFVDGDDFNSPLAGWNTTRLPADASGDSAFGFDAVDLITGETIPGEDLFARRPLVIGFITPTCPICAVEAPKLASAAEQNPEVTFVIVHNGSEDDDYFDFIETTDIGDAPVVHVVDGDVSLWTHFGVLQQPSYVLVDAEGVVRSSTGALEDHGLLRAADDLLERGSS